MEGSEGNKNSTGKGVLLLSVSFLSAMIAVLLIRDYRPWTPGLGVYMSYWRYYAGLVLPASTLINIAIAAMGLGLTSTDHDEDEGWGDLAVVTVSFLSLYVVASAVFTDYLVPAVLAVNALFWIGIIGRSLILKVQNWRLQKRVDEQVK